MPNTLNFYKINSHFIQIKDAKVVKIFEDGLFEHFKNGGYYSFEELACFDECLPQGNYVCYFTEAVVGFYQISGKDKLWRILFNKSHIEKVALYFEKEVTEFRHRQKEILLSALTKNNLTLETVIQAFANYTFSEHYSVWLYNENLNIFSLLVSTFSPSGLVINQPDSNTLYESVKKNRNKSHEHRDIAQSKILSDAIRSYKLKYLNRIKVKFGDYTAVISFYSPHNNFIFSNSIVQRVSNGVKGVLLESLEVSHQKFEYLRQKLNDDVEDLSAIEYVRDFLKELKKSYNLKACGLVTLKELNVEHFASEGEMIEDEDFYNYLKNNVDIDSSVTIFNKERVLTQDNEFVDKFNCDLTTSVAKAFLVANTKFCLIITPQQNNDSKRHFLPFTEGTEIIGPAVSLLKFEIKNRLSYSIVQDKYKQSQNFMKVWRHEIRSPITKFMFGSDIIKLLMTNIECPSDKKVQIDAQLEDIKVIGLRLKQLTDFYDIERMIDKVEITSVSVLGEVVIHVQKTCKEYAQKQYQLEIEIDRDRLRNLKVNSDLKLLNLVLHAAVDNALKYSIDESNSIMITGKSDEDYIYISVQNEGFKIDNSDVDRIFKEGERGLNATTRDIDGTGVGLYIAQKVIRKLKGSLMLTKNDNKLIEFTIAIPKKWETSE
ncbi:MAG: signal transduction histidine kinase [Psychrosphaera sp.]|jgi:signal transduction histidine kinase